MKKFTLTLLVLLNVIYYSFSQVNYQVSGVNSWGIYSQPTAFSDIGLNQEVSFDDLNPKDGSIRGFASLNVLAKVDDKRKLTLQVYMTSYSITWIYFNGKWQTISQVKKCTGAKKFELSSIQFEVRNSISIEEEIMYHPITSHTITPPNGAIPYFKDEIKYEGTLITETVYPYTASVGWPGLKAVAKFVMTPEISANIGNIKADCGAPKSVTENQNSSDGLVANYTSTKPQVKSGMSITESIKSKMPLIDEGYKCVYFTEVNGADCTENAVQIQNSCRQSMKVQLKTTNGSNIHTVPANGVKTVKVGCDQKVKFAAIPAISNTNNLLSDQEWYLINVIDKTGKARVNVPYESPKPVVKQIASNSGSSSQSNPQNGVKTNSVKSGSSSNGNSGFDVTSGYFAAEGPYGNYKKFWIYRFSNQSWQQGNNWFRNIEQNYDSNGGGGDASMDWNFWGSWELVGNQIKLKRWQAGVQNPEQLIFKIEGKDLRLIKYITHWGKESSVNVLYKHYVNMPPWPIRNHLVSVLSSNFPPR